MGWSVLFCFLQRQPDFLFLALPLELARELCRTGVENPSKRRPWRNKALEQQVISWCSGGWDQQESKESFEHWTNSSTAVSGKCGWRQNTNGRWESYLLSTPQGTQESKDSPSHVQRLEKAPSPAPISSWCTQQTTPFPEGRHQGTESKMWALAYQQSLNTQKPANYWKGLVGFLAKALDFTQGWKVLTQRFISFGEELIGVAAGICLVSKVVNHYKVVEVFISWLHTEAPIRTRACCHFEVWTHVFESSLTFGTLGRQSGCLSVYLSLVITVTQEVYGRTRNWTWISWVLVP